MTWKDATEQASAIKSGKISAKELVLETIEKIEKLNPELNAVVSTQFDEALEKATALTDTKVPFAGVPILLKDLGQNQVGQLSTSGSRLFAHYRASHDDYYTKKIQELGFIVLGRTNTPEFGFKNISDSQLHGSVNLPKDYTRNAGGSSGGAAAAIASGMVQIAGASDGGGSIRIPASFNGLIGLKPTRGRLPVGPSSYRGWQGASSHFALTKSVRDTRALLYGMQTCQLESPFPLPMLSQASLFGKIAEPLTIAYCLESPIGTSVSKEAQQAVLEAVDTLKQLGHKVVQLDSLPVDGIEVMKSYYLMNGVETAQMFDEIEQSFKRPMTIDDMELMTWAIYQSGQTIPAKRYSKVLQDWDRYSAVMSDFHQTYDLLLTPTVADVAPKHGQFTLSKTLQENLRQMDTFSMLDQQDLIWQMFEHSLAWTPFTQLQNLTGQPAISLPTFEREDGLPIGVQLAAAKGREDLLLTLAAQLEENHFLKM
ncbi:amidase [Streptococcus hillyeri]|uniref:Amidase n=1 Tax=Streptococcus hillyeri TaxID=2282420 RepID=A0A3L9DQ72_9STRE|nr:amidase [Streptococcus hillyeri]RLY02774.1 amidase [Streptococcus hillyeri]